MPIVTVRGVGWMLPRDDRKVSGAARSGPPLAKVLARGLVVIAGVVFVVNSVAVGL